MRGARLSANNMGEKVGELARRPRPPHPMARLIRRAAVPVILLALWEIVSDTGIVDSYFLPPPHRVIEAGWTLLKSGTLVADVGVSLYRLLSGYFIGAIAGIAVGVLIGRSVACRRSARPADPGVASDFSDRAVAAGHRLSRYRRFREDRADRLLDLLSRRHQHLFRRSRRRSGGDHGGQDARCETPARHAARDHPAGGAAAHLFRPAREPRHQFHRHYRGRNGRRAQRDWLSDSRRRANFRAWTSSMSASSL